MLDPDHTNTQHDQRARRLLAAHCLGTILADKVPTNVRYLILPSTGQLVLDVDKEILDADEHVLMIPEDRFDTPLSLLLDLGKADTEEYHDRHRSYHGDSPLPMFALASIISAKLDNAEVIDQDAIQQPNPLASGISRIGRLLNSDREILASICETLTGARPDHPTAVCVDPFGFHVRARFGVIRVLFPSECESEEQAVVMVESLIKNAQA